MLVEEKVYKISDVGQMKVPEKWIKENVGDSREIVAYINPSPILVILPKDVDEEFRKMAKKLVVEAVRKVILEMEEML